MKGYCSNCNKDSNYHIVKKEVNEFEGVNLNNCYENVAICDKCGGRIYVEDLETENRKNILTEYRRETNSVTPEEIEKFRKKYSISQRELSAILGYAKMTINRYERGAIPDKSHNDYLKIIINNEKEFFKIVEQAYQLARITEKTYKKIVNIDQELINEYKYYDIYKDIIKSQLNFVPNKYNGFSKINTDAIFNIISYIADNVKNLTITSMNKYLWFIDMLSYKIRGISITGLTYEKETYGPVIIKKLYRDISIASDKFERIDSEDKDGNLTTKIISKENFDMSEFDKEEMQIINKVIAKLKNKSVSEISEMSHKEEGWKKTKRHEKISFEYAKDLYL